jgi:predicted acylesterase/phospholipase RssA
MTKKTTSKIGLACAGGAIEGAAYEIGALVALEQALDGVEFEDLDIYVGVSAGAFINSCLANGIDAPTLAKAFISKAPGVMSIQPGTFFKPALAEYRKRLFKLPSLIGKSVWDYVTNPLDISLTGSFAQMTDALPVGLFDNSSIRKFLHENFEMEGRTDDFRKLDKILRVIATNLESGEIVRFGEPPYDDIPISQAVQASTALPFLYTPVEIHGDYYIDGVARRTVHASTALKAGAELVFCINPIVPVDAKMAREVDKAIQRNLLDSGLPTILSQTFRMMIYSRMHTGFKNYEYTYPDADLLVFEPKPSDYRMFYTNIFSFENRKEVCEYAYHTTRRDLLNRADELEPVLEKYGITLNRSVLEDETKTLYPKYMDKQRRIGGHQSLKQVDEVLDALDRILDDIEDIQDKGEAA